jgi:transposase
MNGLAYDTLSAEEQALIDASKLDPERAFQQSLIYFLQRVKERDEKILLLETEVAKLEEERRLDRARRFGSSSEAGDHQYRLFDEAEAQQDESDGELDGSDLIEVGAHTKRKPKRKPLPADLPRVVINHDVDDADKVCACGAEMHVIGEKITEQLDVIPAQAYVIENHRPTYSCSKCDESIKTAPMPPQPIPKSLASPGLLAHVAIAKYADGLPLYRQSKQFQRLGIDLPRNTLATHMIKVGQLINPLIEQLKRHVLGYDLIGMDETPVQVLKEPGKPAQSTSYMWVMKGGPPQQPALLYHYAPTRAQSVPEQLLKDYAGYLQTDGYAGYHAVLGNEAITGLGCWAHVRRKFMDARKALPKAQHNKGNRVQVALSFITQLYQLERAIHDLEPEERLQRRLTDAVVILDRFKTWLDKQSVPPKTLLGKAIGYALREWPRLVVYTTDGRLNIDNNLVENAIRPFAIGRKAWLFSDSQAGARASANLYSLVETAKANGINDYAYLKYVFTQLPTATTDETMQALMPWRIDPACLEAQLIKPT